MKCPNCGRDLDSIVAIYNVSIETRLSPEAGKIEIIGVEGPCMGKDQVYLECPYCKNEIFISEYKGAWSVPEIKVEGYDE